MASNKLIKSQHGITAKEQELIGESTGENHKDSTGPNKSNGVKSSFSIDFILNRKIENARQQDTVKEHQPKLTQCDAVSESFNSDSENDELEVVETDDEEGQGGETFQDFPEESERYQQLRDQFNQCTSVHQNPIIKPFPIYGSENLQDSALITSHIFSDASSTLINSGKGI